MRVIIFLALLGTTGFFTLGSWRGLGLAAPVKEPLSIREGSIRKGRSGTSYFSGRRRSGFVGGGYIGGK